MEDRQDTTSNEGEGMWRVSIDPQLQKYDLVCYTDTFETGDTNYKYGQVVVDYRSRFGDVFPLRSRKKVGWAFGEFCCRHFVPLILIRDNISENTTYQRMLGAL
jgi:hypothetical protein